MSLFLFKDLPGHEKLKKFLHFQRPVETLMNVLSRVEPNIQHCDSHSQTSSATSSVQPSNEWRQHGCRRTWQFSWRKDQQVATNLIHCRCHLCFSTWPEHLCRNTTHLHMHISISPVVKTFPFGQSTAVQ